MQQNLGRLLASRGWQICHDNTASLVHHSPCRCPSQSLSSTRYKGNGRRQSRHGQTVGLRNTEAQLGELMRAIMRCTRSTESNEEGHEASESSPVPRNRTPPRRF